MKFSWKLCVSVLALSMAVTGIGGYALLSALFQSAYRRRLKARRRKTGCCSIPFAAYWSTALREGSSGFPETDVRRTAQAMQEGMAGTELRFQLYNREGKELYDSGAAELLGQGQREQLFLTASEETRVPDAGGDGRRLWPGYGEHAPSGGWNLWCIWRRTGM